MNEIIILQLQRQVLIHGGPELLEGNDPLQLLQLFRAGLLYSVSKKSSGPANSLLNMRPLKVLNSA